MATDPILHYMLVNSVLNITLFHWRSIQIQHILQPCDVSVFKPMKTSWRKIVHEWKFINSQETLNKINFPVLFQVFKEITLESTKNGYKRCGIYPWSPDEVDFSNCLKQSNIKDNHRRRLEQNPQETKKCLQAFESHIADDTLKEFRQTLECLGDWNGGWVY